MPLYKTITVSPNTQVLVWKITESYDDLARDIDLTMHCTGRVASMKSDLHKRGFMSVRHLLKAKGYTDFDLSYDENGKPHLKDGKRISITHSYHFSALIISDIEVGIDIEKQRDKILKIAHKFTPVEEYRTLANDEAIIRKLTMVWGAKESLYKSFSTPGVRFLEHIYVEDFSMEDAVSTATVQAFDKKEQYQVFFEEFEDFTLVYAIII